VPTDLDVIEVPPGAWAVFRLSGPYPAALQSTWAATASDWFPSNPWRLRPRPSVVTVLDRTADFSTATTELWLPVERALTTKEGTDRSVYRSTKPEAIAAKGSLRNDLDPGIEGSGIEPPTGRLRSIKPAGRRTEGSANKDEPARSSEQSASTSTARGSIRSSSAARGCRPAGFGVGTRRMSGRRTPAGHRPPPVP